MSQYNHVLVGLDLSQESQQVLDRVKHLFENNACKISICHILEPLSFTYGGDVPLDFTDLQTQLEDQAKAKLAELGKQLGVSEANQHVIIGQPAQEMHAFAADQGVDLIAVGSHGRHGFSLLLGSTSNSVLHGAKCDVLAVRIQQD